MAELVDKAVNLRRDTRAPGVFTTGLMPTADGKARYQFLPPKGVTKADIEREERKRGREKLTTRHEKKPRPLGP